MMFSTFELPDYHAGRGSINTYNERSLEQAG